MFDIEHVTNRLSDSLIDSLIGCEFDFYGVDGSCFCLGRGGARMALEAVEDPNDGYRSYFACFRTEEVGKIFFRSSIAKVRLERGGISTRSRSYWDNIEYTKDGKVDLGAVSPEALHDMQKDFSGWILRDVLTGHIWLTVGTDFGDDYYPSFTFRYEPDTTPNLSPKAQAQQ